MATEVNVMRRFHYSLVVLFLFGCLVLPRSVRACPMCAESVPQRSAAEEEDSQREAAAYNFSIYLLAGMPFLLVSGFGFWVFRGLRRHAATESLSAMQQPADEGGRLCSLPSPEDVS
jgi:hypothetical protein